MATTWLLSPPPPPPPPSKGVDFADLSFNSLTCKFLVQSSESSDLCCIHTQHSPLSRPPLQGTDIQKKIDHEIRMREGACKLLAACTQRQQALEVAKSLLVCNGRILAYMAELQRMKEAQVLQRVARR